MTLHKNIIFYATTPHKCSYLSDKEATTLFLEPERILSLNLYSHLADIGFRRSGTHVYRPHCASCNACIPARVIASEFKFSRSQKRTWKTNQDLIVTKKKPENNQELYELYQSYINNQHNDGDMFPPSVTQFDDFLVDAPDFCDFYHFRLAEQLIAVSVVDTLKDSLSAIYTFYHPEFKKRSLGRFCILWQIERAKALQMKYLYLGYWIKGCQKMNYKIDYRPIELLIDNKWSTLL